MEHRKRTVWKYRTFKKQHGRNSSGPRARWNVLTLDTESTIHKGKFDKLDQIWKKNWNIFSVKYSVKSMKRQTKIRRKYFQITCLTKY